MAASRPEPLTRDRAVAIAGAEYDRNPAVGVGYVDRANYAASRAHALMAGARPTVDPATVQTPAVADPLKAADPVAVGRWQRDWRYNTGNCRARHGTETDYLRAMARHAAAGRC